MRALLLGLLCTSTVSGLQLWTRALESHAPEPVPLDQQTDEQAPEGVRHVLVLRPRWRSVLRDSILRRGPLLSGQVPVPAPGQALGEQQEEEKDVFNSLVSSGVLDVPPAFSLDPPPRPFLTISPALDRDALGLSLGPMEGSDEEPQQQEEKGEGVQAQEGQQGEEEGAERSEEGATQRLIAILNARPRRYRLRTIASYALPARLVNNAEEAEPSKNGEEGSAAGSQSAFVPVKEGEVEGAPTEQVQKKEGPKEANDKGEENEEEDGEATVEGPLVEELNEDDAAAPVTDSKTPANEATARLQAAFEAAAARRGSPSGQSIASSIMGLLGAMAVLA